MTSICLFLCNLPSEIENVFESEYNRFKSKSQNNIIRFLVTLLNIKI